MTRALGVLHGNDFDVYLLKDWAESSSTLIAADGGANALLEIGISAHIIVGDLDSASVQAQAAANEVFADENQSKTDCDKLLQVAHNRGFDEITLTCAEGDLPDHVLAILQSAARAEIGVRIGYRRGVGWIVKPGKSYRAATRADVRVSLLPIEPCDGVVLQGVRWQLAGAVLSATGLTSISNRAVGDVIECSIENGAALLFVEYPREEMPFW